MNQRPNAKRSPPRRPRSPPTDASRHPALTPAATEAVPDGGHLLSPSMLPRRATTDNPCAHDRSSRERSMSATAEEPLNEEQAAKVAHEAGAEGSSRSDTASSSQRHRLSDDVTGARNVDACQRAGAIWPAW